MIHESNRSIVMAFVVFLFIPGSLVNAQTPSSDETTAYFGHQSVGAQLMAHLAAEDHIARDLTLLDGRVGANGDMRSKVDHFVRTIDEWDSGPRPDIALFKFCYVDMTSDTDIESIFAYYRDQLSALQERHPETQIAHATMPLVAVRLPLLTHVKNLAKIVLGRGTPLRRSLNPMRTEFNELIRAEYGATGLLWDIAMVERTGTEPSSAPADGLRAELSSDGGHLNEAGTALVARSLVAFLQGVAD